MSLGTGTSSFQPTGGLFLCIFTQDTVDMKNGLKFQNLGQNRSVIQKCILHLGKQEIENTGHHSENLGKIWIFHGTSTQKQHWTLWIRHIFFCNLGVRPLGRPRPPGGGDFPCRNDKVQTPTCTFMRRGSRYVDGDVLGAVVQLDGGLLLLLAVLLPLALLLPLRALLRQVPRPPAPVACPVRPPPALAALPLALSPSLAPPCTPSLTLSLSLPLTMVIDRSFGYLQRLKRLWE